MIAMELNQLNVNQTSTGGSAAVVGGPQATGIDHEDEEYQRGHGDGIAWAREYATVDELRDLVERYEPDRSADVDGDHSLCDFASDKGHDRRHGLPVRQSALARVRRRGRGGPGRAGIDAADRALTSGGRR